MRKDVPVHQEEVLLCPPDSPPHPHPHPDGISGAAGNYTIHIFVIAQISGILCRTVGYMSLHIPYPTSSRYYNTCSGGQTVPAVPEGLQAGQLPGGAGGGHG